MVRISPRFDNVGDKLSNYQFHARIINGKVYYFTRTYNEFYATINHPYANENNTAHHFN